VLSGEATNTTNVLIALNETYKIDNNLEHGHNFVLTDIIFE
jgi:hypothetical protein